MIHRVLTLRTLIDKRACVDQVKLFRATFGDSIEISEPLCLSVSGKFDWLWGAQHLLSPTAWTEYRQVGVTARTEYNECSAPTAWADYVGAAAAAFGKLYAEG